MKTKLLLFLFGLLLMVGCATTDTPKEDIHALVIKADQKWAEHNGLQMPKMRDTGLVALERRMYEKVAKSDAPEWRKRRAGWNYIVAVNEAMIPDIPKPPGRGTLQNNPFM